MFENENCHHIQGGNGYYMIGDDDMETSKTMWLFKTWAKCDIEKRNPCQTSGMSNIFLVVCIKLRLKLNNEHE